MSIPDSYWPGGIVHESIFEWIDRQPWTEEGKAAARKVCRESTMAISRHTWLTVARARGWLLPS